MSDNPRDDEGLATQHYLPFCAPEESNGIERAAVYRFGLLLKGMVQRHNITLDEAQMTVARIFRELGRK